MAFLANDAVNRVNLHSALQALARNAGGLFVLIQLLQVGLSVPELLLALAAVQAGRLVLRPLILPLARRVGLQPLLVTGALALALPYFVLPLVRGADGALLALCLAITLGEVFYWVSYNAYFAAVGDNEARGRQLGVREAAVAAAAVVAPLLGAGALAFAGPGWMFAAVGLVQAGAALPLLGLPNIAVAERATGALASARPMAGLSALDGAFDVAAIWVWQIALFGALDGSVAAYGGAMTVAALAGAVSALALGSRIDAGHGRGAALLVYGAVGTALTLQAASLESPWLAVGAGALGALLAPLLGPAIGGAFYNLAKTSPCPLRFTLATEGGWDLGAGAACLVAAALTAAGAPLSLALLLGVPPALAAGLQLRRLYAFGPVGAGVEPASP